MTIYVFTFVLIYNPPESAYSNVSTEIVILEVIKDKYIFQFTLPASIMPHTYQEGAFLYSLKFLQQN